MAETILEKIVSTKLHEIEQAKQRVPEVDLRNQLPSAPPVRSFFEALDAKGAIRLIAEVKKASPSAGLIREDFDPVTIASTYEANGASCISVLTDEQYFQGHLDYLRAVRASVNLPVLRKDFILDTYQLLRGTGRGCRCSTTDCRMLGRLLATQAA